jgi:TolB protein
MYKLGTLILLAFTCSCSPRIKTVVLHPLTDTIAYPEEKHFANVQQLTFGGDNAEAYWSYDNKSIVFQRTSAKNGIPCDQIFQGKLPAANKPFTFSRVSDGKGRTTCAYFSKDGKHVIYASTEAADTVCPPLPDRSKYGNRYIWPIYSSYDIYISDADGKNKKALVSSPGYDAEATLSPDGNKMIFTSTRNGDLDLYIMDISTGKVTQFTNTLGYDGGAWFSADGKKIVWRASRPTSEQDIKEYKDLLKENLVMPTQMEVFIANENGTGVRQVTHFGNANWAPNFLPDGRIIFCSNFESKRGYPFNMYIINQDGTGLEKISHDKTFDAFPMFSYDGNKIIFCSNRNNGGTHDTNIFVADWKN